MMKRLLFSLMAVCMVLSGYALSLNEYVYTPQGRFQVTGNNLNANSAFADFTGWTIVTASDGKTLAEQFVLNPDAAGEGLSSAMSLDATATEGMYYQFTPSNANATYIVSFKMKGAALDNIRIRVANNSENKVDNDKNVVKVAGNTDNVYGGTTDEVIANTAEELTEEWQTFNYAIVGDGTPRTYFISLVGMATTIEFADLQIATATQKADLRLRDAMLEKMNAYRYCYNWSQDVLEEVEYDGKIAKLEAIGDETSVEDLNTVLTECNDVLAYFINQNMDDYLAGRNDRDNYFDTWRTKMQKYEMIGDWTIYPKGRGFWEKGDSPYPDLGHYAGSTTWCSGAPDDPMGVTIQKTLDPGSYVFSISGRAAVREGTSSKSWTNNDGLNVAYGVAYVVKVIDGVPGTASEDTVAIVVKDVDSRELTPFIVVAKTAEEGTYEIGFKVYCKDAYKAMKNGSVTYVANASLYGKNDNLYSQKELRYEADVREQITAGREGLNKAAEYLADVAYGWGKDALTDSVAKYSPLLEKYEAMSQDEIISTFEDGEYVKDINSEDGLLVYEVYQTATRWILASNNKFLAVNDTLNSIQTAIDAAEGTLAMRIYSAATGKEALQTAIGAAKTVQTQMKATDYSVENAATIVAAIATLNEAVETFKTTVPESEIVEVMSLDFETGATLNEAEGVYQIAGNNTVMTFGADAFVLNTPTANEKGVGDMKFELGIDDNGTKVLPGVLRIGNGEAKATVPVRDYGTNILKVSMDFWFLRLSDGLVGFDLVDENSERVAGLYWRPYNNDVPAAGYDDFAIGAGNYASFFKSNTTGDAGSCADNNLSHIECIFDYGEKSMYLVSTNASGSFTSAKVAFNEKVPASFIVKSNYKNYIGRRCWFDNLKMEQITASSTEPFDGIEGVTAAQQSVNAIYSISGQRVNSLKKGLYIINGKKYVVK